MAQGGIAQQHRHIPGFEFGRHEGRYAPGAHGGSQHIPFGLLPVVPASWGHRSCSIRSGLRPMADFRAVSSSGPASTRTVAAAPISGREAGKGGLMAGVVEMIGADQVQHLVAPRRAPEIAPGVGLRVPMPRSSVGSGFGTDRRIQQILPGQAAPKRRGQKQKARQGRQEGGASLFLFQCSCRHRWHAPIRRAGQVRN